jgi:hypothetical protein
MSLLLLFHGAAVVTAPTQTTPLTGYVYGTPASGTVIPQGESGLVIVALRGVATVGDVGYPSWAFPTSRVAVLGYSNQVLGGVVVSDVETLIGRQFHGLRQNQAYTVTGVSTAVTEYDAGRTFSYRAIQFDTLPGGWAAAANGDADTQMLALCTSIINAGRWTAQNPFVICLHHEATLSPFGTTGFLAADYKAMWAHLVPLMLATGAPIAFAYVGWDRMFVGSGGVGPPTAGQGIDDLDPGPSLYTYIGNDHYNNLDAPGVLRYGTYAGTLLNPVIAAAVARGKDFILGEMGCPDGTTTLDHQNKAAWLDSTRVILDGQGAIGPGVCRAMLTTIKASSENFNVDSSAESIAAWQRLGSDTYYA